MAATLRYRIDSLYFSVVTWTTLGYGDFKPIHELEMWVIAEALMGYMFMGLLLAKLVYLSQRGSQSDAQQSAAIGIFRVPDAKNAALIFARCTTRYITLVQE